MNILGIKVGSVEIYRVCNLLQEIQESAAIDVINHTGGPPKLLIFVVTNNEDNPFLYKVELKSAIQKSIKEELNPLFIISDMVIYASLPRTASNKVMQRMFRYYYIKPTP